MVSRSLEKMLLIAVGLTTAVMVGVPVLIYAINTLNNASQFENARMFAERVHEDTHRVDNGTMVEALVELTVPSGVTVGSDNTTLNISYDNQILGRTTWSETYIHHIELVAPTTPGVYMLEISLSGGVLHIEFTQMT